jgi:hypothetical protein
MLEQWWGALKRLFTYAQFCIDNPVSTLACHDFWQWTILGSFGVALLIALVIGRVVVREQLEYYRNRKRLEARTIVADQEVIDQLKWVGDGDADVGLSQQELAAALRAGIQQIKEPTGSR